MEIPDELPHFPPTNLHKIPHITPSDVLELRELNKTIKKLGAIYEASVKWRWRLLAVTVTVASIIGAIFQVLNFYLR